VSAAPARVSLIVITAKPSAAALRAVLLETHRARVYPLAADN
jgi:hypothetical protein